MQPRGLPQVADVGHGVAGTSTGRIGDPTDAGGVGRRPWRVDTKAQPERGSGGLLDRERLRSHLGRILDRRRRTEAVVLVLCELDNFSLVNDELGHGWTDIALNAVTRLLYDVVGEETLIARFGTDEFALVTLAETRAEGHRLAETLRQAFATPLALTGLSLALSPYIGVAIVDASDTCQPSADTLLANGELALSRAKALGPRTFTVFEQALRVQALGRIRARRQLEESLDEGRLVVHFQPIVDLGSGVVGGAEALVRFRDRSGRLTPPDDLLPAAEGTDLVTEIDSHVLDTAVAAAAAWPEVGGRAPWLSCNVSARQLARPDLVALVHRSLTDHGLEPARLRLELTETSICEVTTGLLDRLQELSELGVRIGLDDFGVGYSSFQVLRELPIRFVKVDRSWVRGLPSSQRDAGLVRSVVAMAQTLELDVVVEGVERRDQAEYLAAIGCRWAQGYLYGRPMPAAAFAKRQEGFVLV